MDFFKHIPVLSDSFKAQQKTVRRVWGLSKEIVAEGRFDSPFEVGFGELPSDFLDFKRNIFSSIFISILHLLEVPPERRAVYAALNQLFRAWVTSADNLLDNEDKVTFPVEMAGNSRVMRQVVVIMLADRVMNRILSDAQNLAVLTSDQVRTISDTTLRILLPSAAEEAMEEGGLKAWPEPDFVLNEIHPVKTGILFHIPFLGPEFVEKDVDQEKLESLKEALMDFGVGCQILDDLRDGARDFIERRANYFVSLIQHRHPEHVSTLVKLCEDGDVEKQVSQAFPDVTNHCLKLAVVKLGRAIDQLDAQGLTEVKSYKLPMILFLVNQLDLAHLLPQLMVLSNEA